MLNCLLSANIGLSQFEGFWHQPSDLMLFAWAGFVSAKRTLCIRCQWMLFEHEGERKGWENVAENVLWNAANFWTRHQKHSTATRHLVLFASYLAQTCVHSVDALTTPQACTSHYRTNAGNYPSIHLQCCDSTNFCIPFFVNGSWCARDEKQHWEYESEGVGENRGGTQGETENQMERYKKFSQKSRGGVSGSYLKAIDTIFVVISSQRPWVGFVFCLLTAYSDFADS